MKRETDSGEKGALIGLIVLAGSDMFFCIGVIPQAFYEGFGTLFYSRLELYYQVSLSYTLSNPVFLHRLFMRGSEYYHIRGLWFSSRLVSILPFQSSYAAASLHIHFCGRL
jgi:hypothetical protein